MKLSLIELTQAALSNQTRFEIAVEIYIPKLYKYFGIKSGSEFRRLIDGNAVSINEKRLSSYTSVLKHNDIVRVGKQPPQRLRLPKLELKQCDKIENRKYINIV